VTAIAVNKHLMHTSGAAYAAPEKLTVYHPNENIALGELHSIHEPEFVKGKQCKF
jgi:hypothetical protein